MSLVPAAADAARALGTGSINFFGVLYLYGSYALFGDYTFIGKERGRQKTPPRRAVQGTREQ